MDLGIYKLKDCESHHTKMTKIHLNSDEEPTSVVTMPRCCFDEIDLIGSINVVLIPGDKLGDDCMDTRCYISNNTILETRKWGDSEWQWQVLLSAHGLLSKISNTTQHYPVPAVNSRVYLKIQKAADEAGKRMRTRGKVRGRNQ